MDLDDLRALARSAPWRWRGLRLVVTWHGGRGPHGPLAAPEGAPVRAWVAGRHGLRVEDLATGRLLDAEWEESPGGWRPTGRAGAALAERRGLPVRHELGEWTVGLDDYAVDDPRAPRPSWRDDGLVAARPAVGDGPDDGLDYGNLPWRTYRWVAMLDPWELADGSTATDDGGWLERDPSAVPVRLTDGAAGGAPGGGVSLVDHHGRPAWQAVVTATEAYDPRCSCCPLLPGSVASRRLLAEGGASAAQLHEAAVGRPTAHRVRLDVATGVVVELEQVDGHAVGQGWTAVVEAVDEPYDRTWFG